MPVMSGVPGLPGTAVEREAGQCVIYASHYRLIIHVGDKQNHNNTHRETDAKTDTFTQMHEQTGTLIHKHKHYDCYFKIVHVHYAHTMKFTSQFCKHFV